MKGAAMMNQDLAEQISSFERRLPVNREAFLDQLASFVPDTRLLIISLDPHPAIPAQLGETRWLNLVHKFQIIAYRDPDSGGEADIALWCERQWATTLQREPSNIVALQGLGHAWLLKSQKSLARINEDQRSSGSGSSSSISTDGIYGRAASDKHAARVNTSDYVEARDNLRPSVDFFDRAIASSDMQGEASGELLTLAAEAYISFANVSHPQNNETFYQTSLRYLRRAAQVEGHRLEAHLQTFLDENASFIQ